MAIATPTKTKDADEKVYDRSLDPYQGHFIKSANPHFAGDHYGVRFSNGEAVMPPISRDVPADDPDIIKRQLALEYFFNAHPVRTVEWEIDKRTGVPKRKDVKIPAYEVRPIGAKD